MSSVKVKPTPEEIAHLKTRFEDKYLQNYMYSISGSMILDDDHSKSTREFEARAFFDHVLETFLKYETSTTLEAIEKEFENHFKFKIQLAKRKGFSKKR